jgi:phytoene synthase
VIPRLRRQAGTVAAAYAECERITREQARNFSWGVQLLPATKRNALSAVYAMARRIDDIGDGTLPDDQKLRLLAESRDHATRPAEFPDDPVCLALADAAVRLPIPLAAFGELVDGCEMDVTGRSYDSLDELVTYCRCVAGSIGRLSLGVFQPALSGAAVTEAAQIADSLGIALQLTNILRDVREDLLNGRVYLPKQDLALFGVTLATDSTGALDAQDGALAQLVRYEAARAGDWYDRGLRLLPLLDYRSAASCAAIAGIYRELLRRIAANPSGMMSGRMALSTQDKLWFATRSLVRRR